MSGSCDNGFIFIGRNARWSDFAPRLITEISHLSFTAEPLQFLRRPCSTGEPKVLSIEIHKIHDVGVT